MPIRWARVGWLSIHTDDQPGGAGSVRPYLPKSPKSFTADAGSWVVGSERQSASASWRRDTAFVNGTRADLSGQLRVVWLPVSGGDYVRQHEDEHERDQGQQRPGDEPPAPAEPPCEHEQDREQDREADDLADQRRPLLEQPRAVALL